MRTHVLLLFGGESSEHDVSVSGAANVFAALDDDKYDIHLCYIDRAGKWWLVPEVTAHHQNCPQLVPVLGSGKLLTIPEGTVLHPDVILPILHGKNGEDGTIQGLAKLLHVPVVGPSVLGAALTMDKEMTKRLLREAGVPVADWILWTKGDDKPHFEPVAKQLGSTSLFVKPSNAGSSVGVSRIEDKAGFAAALEKAAEHDDKVLIEPAIEGREIEVAVLGNRQPATSLAGEIKVEGGFYDYEAKYDPGSSAQVIVPADLPEATVKRARELSLKAYQVCDGRGMARVDLFATDSGDVYLNEINSIPGFTNISMYPKLWRERGVSYPALLDKLISLALDK